MVRKLEGLEEGLRKHKVAGLATEELAARLAALQAARALEEEIAVRGATLQPTNIILTVH